MGKRRLRHDLHAPIEVTVKVRVKGYGKAVIKTTAGPGDGRSILRQARLVLRHAATDAHQAVVEASRG